MSSSTSHPQHRAPQTPQRQQTHPTPRPSSPHRPRSAYLDEERLGRAWRSLASSIVVCAQRTDKAAKSNMANEQMKELDDAVVTFLRLRMEWGRQISHIEAKLQGKTEEAETFDSYLKCQPTVGKKRKREADSEEKQEQQRTGETPIKNNEATITNTDEKGTKEAKATTEAKAITEEKTTTN